MAQINWQEVRQSGRKGWRGGGPYRDLSDHWEIVLEADIVTGDPEYHCYASDELGGNGYRLYEALAIDWFLTLEDAKACCQAMHDEAISGCDTGW